MDFQLSDDQKMLVDTVSSFAKKDSPVERFRRLRKSERGWEAATWKQMGELGWLGVMFPEAAGGAGMSFVEAGLVLEQLGQTLVPEPYIPSVVLAGTVLLHGGDAAQHERFLTPMIAGDTSLALAYTEAQSRHDVADVATRAERKGDGWSLTGKKRWVLNGHAADEIVVSARTSGAAGDRGGVTLFAVAKGAPGLTITPVDCMDGHKAALLDFADVTVDASRRIGAEGGGVDLLDRALDNGAAAACCEASGLLQAVLMMTRNYLCERKQFGAAIGSFQALQHRLVDMFVETELAKSTAIMAMIKSGESDAAERARAISAAKCQLATGGGFVVRQGIQLHGGIGVTDEHDVGLYFKRHQVLASLFGDEHFHVARYAALPSFTRNL